MGKKSNRDYSVFSIYRNSHPGNCMWGILDILNFHHWHSVRKMLPHRRHWGGRHAEDANNETDNDVPDIGDAEESMHSEVDAQVSSPEKTAEASLTKRKSGKARIRKLIAEAMSKHDHHKHRPKAHHSRLWRTDSFRHVGASAQDQNEDECNTPTSSAWNLVRQNIPFHKYCEVCSSISTLKNLGVDQLDELKRLIIENETDISSHPMPKKKALSDMELHRDVTLYQSKEFLEALEVFTVKKALFLKILEDPDYALAHHFQGLRASNVKRGLARSGTFPIASPTEEQIMKRLKLKTQQKEKAQLQGLLETDNTTSTVTTTECSEDSNAASTPLGPDNSADTIDKGIFFVDENKLNMESSPGTSHELKKRRRRFKDFRQKIIHAIRESRKEVYHRVSMDAILHKIPYGRRFSRNTRKEMCKHWKESAMDINSKDKMKSTNEFECSARLCQMRRTASLNESLDRYAQLFESICNQEAKQHPVDRLRLTKEDGCSQVRRTSKPKSLGRILSLPDLECYRSLQSEATSDNVGFGKPSVFLVNGNECKTLGIGKPIKEDYTQSDAFSESRHQKQLLEVDETSHFERGRTGLELGNSDNDHVEGGESGKGDPKMRECSSISLYEHAATVSNNTCCKLAQPSPSSVFDFSLQEGVASPSEVFTSKGHELKPRCIHFDETGTLDSSSVDSSPTVKENVRIPRKTFDSDSHYIKVDKKDVADFNYVRDLLKLSGFTGARCLGTWHAPDQPLHPSLFEEMEYLSPYKTECTVGEISDSYYDHHQLLFDTVNEVLLEIYERSFTYWPGPLSRNSSTRPMPAGYNILKEVWGIISWYLSSQPEEYSSLDYVVTRDLSRVDGWMNLQMDCDCLGLELEDLIFEDLLEEVICSRDCRYPSVAHSKSNMHFNH
ncbi:uncharacterized protein LOC113310789 isoform X2 [Papaver somniferum]|uniref:uncharacterized protein LOC113310789 isoform X2 n=1 Tax=Papaver somniferum TaxID=3469 RepID=UPI000E6FDCF4|nr:uncharacterized protein LOC113310789 isoform X2 [Papaver somniferum]